MYYSSVLIFNKHVVRIINSVIDYIEGVLIAALIPNVFPDSRRKLTMAVVDNCTFSYLWYTTYIFETLINPTEITYWPQPRREKKAGWPVRSVSKLVDIMTEEEWG